MWDVRNTKNSSIKSQFLLWPYHSSKQVQFSFMCSAASDSCNPIDYSPLGSPVCGIFQARILEWIAISSCRRLSQPRDRNCVSCISCVGRQILYHYTTWEAPEMILDSNLSSALSAAICIAFRYPNCNSDFQDGLSPPPKKEGLP